MLQVVRSLSEEPILQGQSRAFVRGWCRLAISHLNPKITGVGGGVGGVVNGEFRLPVFALGDDQVS